MESYEKNITIKGLIDAYGRHKASIILDHEIRRAIINTQQKMRVGKPLYKVLLKDPIAGKLIIKTDHVLQLEYVGNDNKHRDCFTKSEVDSMRRIMPGFDKYYEIRRAGFDNE